jgi:hypothetical protein
MDAHESYRHAWKIDLKSPSHIRDTEKLLKRQTIAQSMGVDDYLRNTAIPAEQRARIILYAANESRPSGGEWTQSGYVGRLDALLETLDEGPLRSDLKEFRDLISGQEFAQMNYVAFEWLYRYSVPSLWRA